MKNLFGYLVIILFALGAATFLTAAQKKEARVTQVIHDVRLLASKTGARPAAINDNVNEGTAVRTGTDSRAELTFTDQTLSRIGANSVFTFGDGAKQFDLASGAMLLAVPKQNGAVRVHMGAATAAISGFTAMFENNKIKKVVVLEGDARVTFKNFPNNPCRVESGHMIAWSGQPTTCPEVHAVDVGKIVKTAKLVTLAKLPLWSWEPIKIVIDSQAGNPPAGGYTDPSNVDATDQRNAGEPPLPPPRIVRPPSTPPPS